ncbi:MAG: amidohydrolase family protein [Pyrinomonadaceae bacterium]
MQSRTKLQKPECAAFWAKRLLIFPSPTTKRTSRRLAYTEKFVKKWKNHSLIVPAFAPHAAYTVSEEHLGNIKKLADKLNAAVVIHVAETQTEVDDISKQKGLRPVEYLDKIGFLNDRTIAAHVVFVNENEVNILKNRGVGVAHNPQSNMKLASGVAPVPQMLVKDLPVGLGTDGAASNNDLKFVGRNGYGGETAQSFRARPKGFNRRTSI